MATRTPTPTRRRTRTLKPTPTRTPTRTSGAARSGGVARGPREQPFDRPRVDHVVGVHARDRRPLAPVGLPLELADRVRVAVDRHLCAERDDLLEQPHRRVETLGSAVDLD